MPFIKIEMLIEAFPKLKEEYDGLVSEGYRPSKYKLETDLQEELSSDMLEIVMVSSQDSKILISQHKFQFLLGKFSDVFKCDLSSKLDIIYPNFKLSKENVQQKEFKKKLIGGYDCNEVDGFLDIIAEDYQIFMKRGIK